MLLCPKMCPKKGRGVGKGLEHRSDEQQLRELSLETKRGNLLVLHSSMERGCRVGESQSVLPSSKQQDKRKCPQVVPEEV